MSKRYARQIALADVGADGQAKLGRARVLVVGLGGLGCPAALYLATSGIGKLVLNDFDRVDETNLPRQILYAPDDVGALKVEAAKKRLNSLNPGVEVVALAERLDGAALEAAVGAVDIVLDGTDNFAARFAVNRACVARRVPLVSGAAVRVEGQIAVFPNDGEGPCYACLYNDEDEWLGDCQGNGVLAPVPGVIGTLMAEEALKLALGWDSSLRNRLLLWDARRGDWQAVALKRDPDCVVCGRGT
ncbi:MAG TPA: HesA/MoeB/ThiF family protein [Gammaproteobacteria bacterium]|nr:HesA/MoeB/ThiF family protein [Gammaproteobacteria bacterium]